MVLGALHWNGLGTTLTIESNMYNTTISNQKLPLCHVEFHKDPFLDPYYSSYIQNINWHQHIKFVKKKTLNHSNMFEYNHQMFLIFPYPACVFKMFLIFPYPAFLKFITMNCS